MRFIFGPIPKSETLDAESEGWTPLSEPDVVGFRNMAILLALPFVIVALVMLFEVISPLYRSNTLAKLILGSSVILMIPLHETLHALGYLVPLRSPHLTMFVWRKIGWGVMYDAPLSRNRVLLMIFTPLFLLTVLPMLGHFFLPPAWRPLALFLAIVHASICTGDFQTIHRILRQVPRTALIHNKNWQTYWLDH